MNRKHSELLDDEQLVLNAELTLLGRGKLSDYLLDKDNSFTDRRFCTEAGWTEIRQNRAAIVQELATRLFMTKLKVAEILYRVEKRFLASERVIIETKMNPKQKAQIYFSDTPAQGKQQMIVWFDGRAFESITQAGEILGKELGISRYTLARRLRNGSL